MPIYNYKCNLCNREYESMEKMGTQTIKCKCGNVAIKIPSLSNFHLKGSGWAKDNYSKEKESKT